DTRNMAGGPAYSLSPKQALAQYAATGCLHSTFYASAEQQLDRGIALSAEGEPEVIARAPVYTRTRGVMKDMPAPPCAAVPTRRPQLLSKIFPKVIDDGKMLRNFVQIIRSGVVGRKSLGSLPKRLVREWFEARSDEAVFRSSVGTSPSLADVIKMVHPRPKDA